jgi:general stress protein 26
MAQHKTEQEKRAKVREMINSIRDAVLVSRVPDGSLHGRPMSTAEVDEQWEKIWFATQRDSGKVHELKDDDHVYLGYSKSGEYVSVSGRARIVKDSQKAKDLWSPLWKNWFSGPDDPNLMLLEITPETAEYWDSGSKVFALAAMATAAVTGKHVSTSENEKVSFQHG